MSTPTLLAILAVGVPAIAALVVSLVNLKGGADNRRSVEALGNRSASLNEFEKLRTALREELNEALRRIESLETAVETERTKREAADQRARAAEERADDADRRARAAAERADALQRRVTHLEKVLRHNHIDPDEVPS